MGCGQSKINLYPRRNKSGNKANGAKKTGATDKDTDEEEGTAGGAGGAGADDDVTEDDCEKSKHLLPLTSHSVIIEVSASQQDFFKMLDEKIEKGKDYDSSSETEVRLERERRMTLIREWQSTSQSSTSQPSPPTPARRRPPPPRPERQGSPASAVRRHQQSSQISSPPSRRCHSAQGHQHDVLEKKGHINGQNWQDSQNSPVRRPQSAGSDWKVNPKVAPYCQKSNDPSQKDTLDGTNSSQDSQITYNPTFQTHSPAHVPHKATLPQQPYIAQIVTYPTVSPAPPNSYISPTETYHEQATVDPSKYSNVPRQPVIGAVNPHSNIYYIHGNVNQHPTPEQLLTQKQQTALHLQQYVAMKQAQQNMFGYLQRMPQAIYANPNFPHQIQDPVTYDTVEENYGVAYYDGFRGPPRPRSAPIPNNNPIRQVAPGANPHMQQPSVSPIVNQVSMFTHITPIVPPGGYSHYPQGQFPQTEVQYYHQAQLMQNMYRPGSAGSAGTLTRYQKDKHSVTVGGDAVISNECQSINIVRQKPVGQIVSLGGQDLGVYQNTVENRAISPGHEGKLPAIPSPRLSEDPGRSSTNLNQRCQADIVNQKCSSANSLDKAKKSNAGSLKSRTQSLNSSKSVDTKKD